MRGKKFLLYDRDKRLINFLEKIALPYIRFRYNSTYKLEVCDSLRSVKDNLESIDYRVDFCCFHMQDESDIEIYSDIKKQYINLPILLCAYSKIDQNLFFRPGLFPEELITTGDVDEEKTRTIIQIEEALYNIKDYLDRNQPDELQEQKKCIRIKSDADTISFINGQDIISIESENIAGKKIQWIKTIRGIYPCKISLSELEKIYSTILFRCRRDALVNKSMIRGFNEQTLDIILETENKYYTMRASNAKYRQIKEAYNLFCKKCEA